MARAKGDRAAALDGALLGAAMTRAVTLEQIQSAARDRPLERRLEVREINEDARTVELSFASEVPVRRWFGDEVLSCEPGAIRLDRLVSGGALLMDHDWRDQVGVVESVSIGDDRRARAVVRFSRSARGQEVFQDVLDGIRQLVSVGYEIRGYSVEERQGLPDLVTVTDWEPYEISIVSVPADATVGVGRAHQPLSNPPEERAREAGEGDASQQAPVVAPPLERGAAMERTLRDRDGNLVRARVDAAGEIVEVLEIIERADAGIREAIGRGEAAERTRVASILQMGDQYGAQDLAREFATGNRTAEDFRAALLERMKTNRGGALTEANPGVGLTEAEAGRFSIVRALRALANPQDRAAREAAAFEFEVSEAAAARMGRTAQGVMVPPEVLTRPLVPADGSRALTTGTAGGAATGGHLISTQLLTSSFVDILRNRSIMMQLATPLTGLVGLIDIPKLIEGQTGYWIGEDDSAPETSIALGQMTMSPKTCAGLTEITRRMLMQSSMDVEALVRADLARAIGQTIDLAGLYGTGTGNQPLGVSKHTGINVVEFGGAASGGAKLPTFGEVVKMETEVAADNADVAAMAYVFNARMRGHMKTTEKFAGTGRTIWEEGGTVNGYRGEVTNQVVAEDLFFGNWADAILGTWGGLDITIDPFTHSAKGRLRIVAMQDVDWGVRRVESFCYGTDSN